MTADRAAIALLFLFHLANAFLLWRISNGCRVLARAVGKIQVEQAKTDAVHARIVADLAKVVEKDMRARSAAK